MDQIITVAKKHVPSVIQALKDLAVMRELNSAETYAAIRKVIKQAEALRILMDEIDAVRQRADLVILLGKRRIGLELKKVPKAKPGPKDISQRGEVTGMASTGIHKDFRSRLGKLTELTESQVRNLCHELWRGGEDATLTAILREHKQANQSETRRRHEREIAGKIKGLPDKRYGVIYADPPWRFETYSERGMDRSAENHYPTQATAQIAGMKIADKVAAKDCVLFLWATVPMLPQCLGVMFDWGFNYKSAIAWAKDKAGTGYWVCGQCELLLIGARGNIPAPAPGEQPPAIIEAPRGRHSEKPEIFYEIIEQLFPNLPRIELYARNKRKGWDSWGPELPEIQQERLTA
jgi:N6-adenosine-specific RNA methylase IME4